MAFIATQYFFFIFIINWGESVKKQNQIVLYKNIYLKIINYLYISCVKRKKF